MGVRYHTDTEFELALKLSGAVSIDGVGVDVRMGGGRLYIRNLPGYAGVSLTLSELLTIGARLAERMVEQEPRAQVVAGPTGTKARVVSGPLTGAVVHTAGMEPRRPRFESGQGVGDRPRAVVTSVSAVRARAQESGVKPRKEGPE